jgi:hypothetical protein
MRKKDNEINRQRNKGRKEGNRNNEGKERKKANVQRQEDHGQGEEWRKR